MRVVATGLGNGLIRFVKLGVGANKVVGEVSHDEMRVEGVAALGFDAEGRMISGGGQIVKLWREKMADEQDDEDEEEGEKNSNEVAVDGEEDIEPLIEPARDFDDSDENSKEDSDEELKSRPKKKKKGKKDKGSSHGLQATFKGLD